VPSDFEDWAPNKKGCRKRAGKKGRVTVLGDIGKRDKLCL
jgi:hypothetical protein